jgi:hypothetical protein
LAGGLLFVEKSAKGLHYFGLDCMMLEYSFREPLSIAVDDFFQAYPMMPLSCKSNLAKRHL